MNRYATVRSRMQFTANFLRRLFAGMLWLTAAAGGAQAGEIYKSIDANGNVVYSDHLDPSMLQSKRVQLEDPSVLPRELHFCWTNCFTLILDNGVYRRSDGTDESWTVETFSPTAVALHRHDAPADWNGYSQDVLYAGQVSNDRLIGVTVNGKPTSGIDASWGTALTTLPGSNAERDAKVSTNPDALSSGTVTSAAAPPPLPVEEQPTLVQDGDLWTPGYWYWRDQGFVWIPGAWVHPPQSGFLWTPAYWASAGSIFIFHAGHWGSTVGFYGGVNYGHGYSGNGYTGGHWIGNSFAYNSAITHLNPAVVHHSYAESVPNPGSRGISNIGEPRVHAANHPQNSSLPRAPNSAATTSPRRTSDPTPKSIEIDKPAAMVRMPAPTIPAKSNHVTPTRVPVRKE